VGKQVARASTSSVYATCDVAGSSSFSRATSNPKTLSVDPRNRHTVPRILIDSIRASGNRNIRLDAPMARRHNLQHRKEKSAIDAEKKNSTHARLQTMPLPLKK
jgi:hypothetical protein